MAVLILASSTAAQASAHEQNAQTVRAAFDHGTFYRSAARALGISRATFGILQRAVDRGELRYAELPRRFARLAYESNGIVRTMRDVAVMPGAGGWHIDVAGMHLFIDRSGDLAIG